MLRADDSGEKLAMFQQLRYIYPDERIMQRFEMGGAFYSGYGFHNDGSMCHECGGTA